MADVDELRILLELPDHIEAPYVPEFNPLTAEKIELGRHLFYDTRLSGNQTQSCGSCHIQELAFADDQQRPTGSTGDIVPRNSQGLANVAFFSTLTWASNGLRELEDQIQIPLRADNPTELGITDGLVNEVIARFQQDPDYQRMFTAAFPDSEGEVTMNRIVFALASFCRSIISGSSRYDKFVAGDRSVLNTQEKRGLSLFNSERLECFHCHSGINLTTSYRDYDSLPGSIQYPFFNNALYNVGGDGGYPDHDQGLYNLTLDPAHRGLFRPQSLRNVALTAPYMHDGSIATLREVIEHYANGGRVIADGPFAGDGRVSPNKSGLIRGFPITEEEIDDLTAFLETLTDEAFLTDPRFSNPFE